MKLAIDTYETIRTLGCREGLSAIKKAGFEAVDYSLFTREDRWLLRDDYREQAVEIRSILDDVGLVCDQTHAPFAGSKGDYKGMMYGDSFLESCPNYLETVRAIEVSAILGANHVVVHSLKVPQGEDLMSCNIAFYKSLLPYLEKYNMKIAVENLFTRVENGFRERIGTADGISNLLRQLNSDRFVVCVDVGHAYLVGIAPQNLISGLKPGCVNGLHIQDTDSTEDRHLLPYMGNIEWEHVLRALKDAAYEGNISLEVTKYLMNLPAELMGSALKYAAVVADYLRRRYELI